MWLCYNFSECIAPSPVTVQPTEDNQESEEGSQHKHVKRCSGTEPARERTYKQATT